MRALSTPASRDGFFVLGMMFLVIGAVTSVFLAIAGAVFMLIAIVQSMSMGSKPFQKRPDKP